MARHLLWLNPQRKPVEVDLERFRNYPHFFESFEQYGVELPEHVTVVWKPIKRYLQVFDEPKREKAFILKVARWIKTGIDVPPLLVHGNKLFDGAHRAAAAWVAGLNKAPVIDISAYDDVEVELTPVYKPF